MKQLVNKLLAPLKWKPLKNTGHSYVMVNSCISRYILSINISAFIFVLFSTCAIFYSCNNKNQVENPLFNTLESNYTGLHFSNNLKPTPEFNLFSYMYFYNGAGIGAGDFNNDGLVDLFFTANQGDNKLFINKGGLKFEDVTKAATIPQDAGWSTGVSVVDINNDGLLDIYICKVGHYKSLQSKNQLLVCQGINKEGIPFYIDEAKEYGLDFSGFSTQAVFFDYDGDGDLDMFLLNHSVNHDGNYLPRENFLNTFDSLAGQKLFRNDSYVGKDGKSKITFTEVTRIAGINGSKIGYGLGVVVADINLDGWPDLYIGNDFHENDYLYINQKNGTFSEENNKRLMHTSQFSMGVDAADINNDAFPEIISMDMLPYDPYMIRRSLAEDDYNIFMHKISYGYNYQYARNNLQLNRRNGLFSEVGQFAGVNATDWSWSALWMDFDNDGYKDLFVSNGIPKRMNDIDYINFVSNEDMQQRLKDSGIGANDMDLIKKFPEIKIPNRFFRNGKSINFQDVTDSVNNNKPSFSNGAIYADLDNDGDLDIVVNNIGDEVLLYENTQNKKPGNASASVKFRGPDNNINAIGAKIIAFANNGIRTYENNPVHGFQSSMLAPIQIGLENTMLDSVFLIWPDNTFQKITLTNGQIERFIYRPHLSKFDYSILANYNKNPTKSMEDITASTGLEYKHEENPFNEYDREPLLPHMLSTEGPAIAVADINHDGLDDVFIGASKTFHNAIFLQMPGGKFVRKASPALELDSMWENVDAIWVDVNNDKNPDLVIATGGNEFFGNDKHLLPLLYMNDGKGNLTKQDQAFSNINVTQSVVIPWDFNGDGFVDLFIGGRTMPWNYGEIPRSYLLQNDGAGKFTDVTQLWCPSLLKPGLVTNAKWIDIDSDGKMDLILCYEWGGIDAFLNKGNEFIQKQLTNKTGWWNFILPIDLENNGRISLVAGNFGLNSNLKASEKEPVKMFYGDFDDNGKKEQVLTYYLQGQEIPFASKQELDSRLPFLKKKYLYAEDFAKARLVDLFGSSKIQSADKFEATYFSNAILLNNGGLEFNVQPFPFEAQLSGYKDGVVVDANNDGLPDLMLFGNYFDYTVEIGRQDADFGSLLINKGKGQFQYEPLNGLSIKGQVRHIKPIKIGSTNAFVLALNNDSLRIIKFR